MPRIFEITDEEEKKVKDWIESLPPLPTATIGGAYSYEFTPTGLGTTILVKRVDGHELDLTADANW